MKKRCKKKFAILLTLFTLILAYGSIECQAAVSGTVSGTMEEKSVTGKLTCSEAGHKLSVELTYKQRDSLTGSITTHASANSVFGNNKEVVQSNSADTYKTISSLTVIGKVDDVRKQSVTLASYGSSQLEYW